MDTRLDKAYSEFATYYIASNLLGGMGAFLKDIRPTIWNNNFESGMVFNIT